MVVNLINLFFINFKILRPAQVSDKVLNIKRTSIISKYKFLNELHPTFFVSKILAYKTTCEFPKKYVWEII